MKQYYTFEEFQRDMDMLAMEVARIQPGLKYIVPVARGGIAPAQALQHRLPNTHILEQVMEACTPANTVIVDDVVDSGKTRQRYEGFFFACIHAKRDFPNTLCVYADVTAWIHYWWEGEDGDITDALVRQLQYIGEDPTREGLQDTPKRIVKSWDTLFGGYKMDPKNLVTSFSEGACDEMVVLSDIEFYSTCEHHMLPFFGKAHIAYIPNGKVLGVSKLARLLDVYARRMQIQERIGQQVTDFLMKECDALGAACILEAQHMCMTSRGVQKQNSVMKTSSLRGVFKDDQKARAELMSIIKK